MGLFDFFKKSLGERPESGRANKDSGYVTYKTKTGTTIKQSNDGSKIFTSRTQTRSGGQKSTTYWYDKRSKKDT